MSVRIITTGPRNPIPAKQAPNTLIVDFGVLSCRNAANGSSLWFLKPCRVPATERLPVSREPCSDSPSFGDLPDPDGLIHLVRQLQEAEAGSPDSVPSTSVIVMSQVSMNSALYGDVPDIGLRRPGYEIDVTENAAHPPLSWLSK